MPLHNKVGRAALFRSRLAAALAEAGLSRAELARRIGVDRSTVTQLLSAGSTRLPNAQVIAEYGDRVAIGLDVRGTTLAARGWTRDGGDLYEVLARLDGEGCARYVVTDVRRDGTMTGPNVELLQQVCAATDRPVVASGGVSSLEDLRVLADLHTDGVEGAIIGKALYAGAFTLGEALEAVR